MNAVFGPEALYPAPMRVVICRARAVCHSWPWSVVSSGWDWRFAMVAWIDSTSPLSLVSLGRLACPCENCRGSKWRASEEGGRRVRAVAEAVAGCCRVVVAAAAPGGPAVAQQMRGRALRRRSSFETGSRRQFSSAFGSGHRIRGRIHQEVSCSGQRQQHSLGILSGQRCALQRSRSDVCLGLRDEDGRHQFSYWI